MWRLPAHSSALCNARRMNQDLARRDRTAIWFAYLSPLIGVPLIGPWVTHALLDDDAKARPYVARAFDLHLLTAIAGFALSIVGIFLESGSGAVVFAILLALLVIAAGTDFVLLFGALKGTRWANPWQPVVLGGRSRYKPEPYIGPL